MVTNNSYPILKPAFTLLILCIAISASGQLYRHNVKITTLLERPNGIEYEVFLSDSLQSANFSIYAGPSFFEKLGMNIGLGLTAGKRNGHFDSRLGMLIHGHPDLPISPYLTFGYRYQRIDFPLVGTAHIGPILSAIGVTPYVSLGFGYAFGKP
jgi:hypothetical protein